MANHSAEYPAVSSRTNGGPAGPALIAFFGSHLTPLLDKAGDHLRQEDYPTLQVEAANLASCARVLGHGFLAEVAGMLSLAAYDRDAERCRLFLAVMRHEWRHSHGGEPAPGG